MATMTNTDSSIAHVMGAIDMVGAEMGLLTPKDGEILHELKTTCHNPKIKKGPTNSTAI